MAKKFNDYIFNSQRDKAKTIEKTIINDIKRSG